jgi:2-polyprenyl-3-methyl-5-hydroxy-6-metoxy-1,4-benzoquinol methylase
MVLMPVRAGISHRRTNMSQEIKQLAESSREIWDRNATAWDAYMGEGGGFQRVLIGPVTERLLALQPDERVLDIACGNGAFSRRMAALGARVVASDFSPKFVELARARTVEHVDRISYHVVDATDESQLLALGVGGFDAAVCTMGIMDMPAVDPLMRAINRLLKPRGRFIFSVMHPCFNGEAISKFVEEEDRAGTIVKTRGVRVWKYKGMGVSKGIGIATQPVPQYYFMRTISTLLGSAFEAGLVVDALEEPAFPPDPKQDASVVWGAFSEIPPVLIVRVRPAGV